MRNFQTKGISKAIDFSFFTSGRFICYYYQKNSYTSIGFQKLSTNCHLFPKIWPNCAKFQTLYPESYEVFRSSQTKAEFHQLLHKEKANDFSYSLVVHCSVFRNELDETFVLGMFFLQTNFGFLTNIFEGNFYYHWKGVIVFFFIELWGFKDCHFCQFGSINALITRTRRLHPF